jgi:hypothetical protein
MHPTVILPILLLLLLKVALVRTQPPPLCSFSTGGFHVVFANVPYANATSVCASLGYQLAALTDLNSPFALAVNEQCGWQPKWIGSFNGLARDPCMVLDGVGGGVQASVGGYCLIQQLPVLCQEIPVVYDSVTARTTDTLTSGTLSLTTTVTRHPTHRPCLKDNLHYKPDGSCRPSCKDCTDYFDVPRSNLKILRDPVPYDRAAAACARYGWTLADISAGLYSTLQTGSKLFNNDPLNGNTFWVRSYEGVSGGRCMSTKLFFDNFFVTFGLTTGEGAKCSPGLPVYPLCQCVAPVPTGFGPIQAVVSTVSSTVTTETSYVTTVPETTTVQTVTVCQACEFVGKPESHHHHTRHHHHRRPRDLIVR